MMDWFFRSSKRWNLIGSIFKFLKNHAGLKNICPALSRLIFILLFSTFESAFLSLLSTYAAKCIAQVLVIFPSILCRASSPDKVRRSPVSNLGPLGLLIFVFIPVPTLLLRPLILSRSRAQTLVAVQLFSSRSQRKYFCCFAPNWTAIRRSDPSLGTCSLADDVDNKIRREDSSVSREIRTHDLFIVLPNREKINLFKTPRFNPGFGTPPLLWPKQSLSRS